MTQTPTLPPTPPQDPPRPPAAPARPAYVAWLREELVGWRADGLVDDAQAAAILARYDGVRRQGVSALVLTLGAAFVGFGVIWLGAANLDQLSPLTRFGLVAAVWLAATIGAELLAARAAAAATPTRRSVRSVGAVRLMAALFLGAVVFQAAQSLQVPAYEPALLAWWGLGALVQAYAVRSAAPLAVGVGVLTGWSVWQAALEAGSAFGAVLALLLAGVVAVEVAALHPPSWSGFAALWREAGALLLLTGLFGAALPDVSTDGAATETWLLGAALLGAALAAVAAVRAGGLARLELLAAGLVVLVAVLLVLWEAGNDADDPGLLGWAHAGVSVAVYVAAAAGVAVLGVLRDSSRLTFLATAALVVFTTFQSFAVFARVIEGAWLFLALGLVLLVTGILAERGRRELAAAVDGAVEDRS